MRRPEIAALLPGVGQIQLRRHGVDRKTVFFESWHGRFADSPKSIFEELRRRGYDGKYVWAIKDPADVPPEVTTVAPGSWEYLTALSRAGTVISNTHMPAYVRLGRGSRYLQTWHGIPLKRIAFDVPGPSFLRTPAYSAMFARYQRAARRDVGAWTWLLSPNAFSSEVFRKAFRYDGAILEVGYPRVDALLGPDSDTVRARVRERFGAGRDTKVVLYAPTFRDRTYKFRLELIPADLEACLGSDWRLLVRAHQTVADTVKLPSNSRVYDVTHEPDIFELYQAADVLITDYSSVMFDFAVTGKPMIFFTYDLVAYRDQLRGFYFDFEARAPGPLCQNSGDVAAALVNLDDLQANFATRYREFVASFCYLEDGSASERVVDQVFPDA
jgi:CDP-glycerol glycerophosphotransferase